MVRDVDYADLRNKCIRFDSNQHEKGWEEIVWGQALLPVVLDLSCVARLHVDRLESTPRKEVYHHLQEIRPLDRANLLSAKLEGFYVQHRIVNKVSSSKNIYGISSCDLYTRVKS